MSIISRFKDKPLLPETQYGVTVGLYPSSDASFDVELQRSVGSSASTSFSKILQLNPSEGQSALQFIDRTPNDNIYRYYRARHVKQGYPNGSYTTIAKAKPDVVLTGFRDYPQLELTGGAVGADIQLAASKSVVVGSAVAGGTKTKSLFLAPYFFVPEAPNTSKLFYSDAANPNVFPSTYGAASTQSLYGPVVLPIGATITRVASFLVRDSTNDTAKVTLTRSGTNLSTMTQAGGGSGEVLSSVMSHAVNSTNQFGYSLRVKLKRGGTTGSATLDYVKVTYTIDDYVTAI